MQKIVNKKERRIAFWKFLLFFLLAVAGTTTVVALNIARPQPVPLINELPESKQRKMFIPSAYQSRVDTALLNQRQRDSLEIVKLSFENGWLLDQISEDSAKLEELYYSCRILTDSLAACKNQLLYYR